MPVKCLGLACSPRPGGNTDLLLAKALEGAAAAGAETSTLALRQYKYNPCISCNGCFKEGQCVVNDDMQKIYQHLLEEDRIILAAPVFSMGICAQAKAAIDRCQRFWATKYILKKPVINGENRPPRRGIFISTAGSSLPKVFDGAEQVAKYFFSMLECEYTGAYLYREIDAKGDILAHPEALDQAYQAGFALGSAF